MAEPQEISRERWALHTPGTHWHHGGHLHDSLQLYTCGETSLLTAESLSSTALPQGCKVHFTKGKTKIMLHLQYEFPVISISWAILTSAFSHKHWNKTKSEGCVQTATPKL